MNAATLLDKNVSESHSLSWGVMVVEEVIRLLWLRCGGGSDSGRGRISGSRLLLRVLVSITDLDSRLMEVTLGCSVLLSASALQ